jgi:hypothetical protein
MTTLIEKLKAATGPDRELDGEIWQQFGSDAGMGKAWNYTASIDAALALVKDVLPDDVATPLQVLWYALYIYSDTECGIEKLPHAILIALLNEIQGEQTQPQTKTQEVE